MTAGEISLQGNKSIPDLAPLEAVLFDVDGTLCDSDPIHHQAFQEMLLEIGFNNGVPIDEEFFIKNIAGRHNDDIAATLFPDDLPRGEKFLEDKEAMFRRLASDNLPPINGLYKLTKWIEDHGLKKAAVTNAPRPNAELMISKLGLKDFFDVVIVGSECERAKPYPDPYLKALELLKVSKDHTFICEDSASGIRAGVAAGMPVVGLTTRNPENVLMEANPTMLVKDYEDPKLWSALEELDKKGDSLKTAA
ncbi:haloacid dehalogenase-like hydrolase domain-containing protein Sgpp isoform X1 [Gossypium australe]|uniref:Haloacid dehalogenase-like hydrolase domain-containing protein Sgpp isoform X1 n=1 Tax=Gossypium australe TaxID=47621 RepID=A0A5B6UTM8_9ROSI|nr:haloacid dehalogenase-like hydrolase domain-containing protein Sgpp isoform X1 [Gossypium australe]